MGHHVSNNAKAVNTEATALRDMKIRDLLRGLLAGTTPAHTDEPRTAIPHDEGVTVLVLGVRMGNSGSLSWYHV